MAEEEKEETIEVNTSSNLYSWLIENNTSLAFTTYQVGKVVTVGVNPNKTVNVSVNSFRKCMGIALKDETMWLSTLFQIWRLDNGIVPGRLFNNHDKAYVPQVGYTTGDLEVHDLIIGIDDKPVFVNTRFNCLSTISDTHSFIPIWKPPFITDLVPEDRCHLNGLAADGQVPKYVTMVAETNVQGAWRDHRTSGGIVMDVLTNEVVCRGLSMPHSPRIHNGTLWLLEAGSGYLGYVDIESKTFNRTTFCPGFLRGLTFIGNYAIVGMSKNRENKLFQDLELDENLKAHNTKPKCGFKIIKLATGKIVEHLHLEGVVRELFDIMIMPQIKNPLVVSSEEKDIHKMVTIGSLKKRN
ncbi:MAG: TIGR03032 family protein [Flavobacteriales bacterium]|nr:TIGR03032 family protein [Flavobacteriales bacterium]